MGLGLDFFGSLLSGGDIGQSLIGDISGGDPSKIFGSKPKVAPYVPVDLATETGKSLAGDLGNYDAVAALLNKIIPGFTDQIAQGSQNALSELQGQIPADVAEQVQRSDAYKALEGGYGGTAMSKALTARDLGLTSVNLMQMGNNTAQVWSNIAEGGFSPWEISAGQEAGTTATNNAGIQTNQQFKYNVKAAPDPSTAGQFALDQHIGDQFLSFGLGAAGGAIAGAGSTAGAGTLQYDPASGRYVASNATISPGGIPYGYVPNDFRSTSTWGGGAGG
jgi:hypothetical protein